MKVLHTADWHFREKDHDEIKKCVEFIVDTAGKEKPDLILISGDITDSKYIDLDSRSTRTILNIVTHMLDISPVAIVTGTESHDGKASLALRECRGRFPILISDYPGQFVFSLFVNKWVSLDEHLNNPFGRQDFLLTQIPQPTKQFFINEMAIEDTDKAISQAMGHMFASFGKIPEELHGIPHIVNGHGQIGGAFISETQQLIGRDIEISKAQLAMLNAHLYCYGHIHKAQELGEDGGIFYAGSPTRMNFGETEDKGFYIHNFTIDIEKMRYEAQSNFILTPAKKMLEIKEDFTDGKEIKGNLPAELEYVLYDKFFPDQLIGADIKISLTVWQDEARAINQTEIIKYFTDAGCNNVKLLLIRKPRETVRAEKVLEAETLPDKLLAMGELRGETISASILDKARALEGGEETPWIDKKGQLQP